MQAGKRPILQINKYFHLRSDLNIFNKINILKSVHSQSVHSPPKRMRS